MKKIILLLTTAFFILGCGSDDSNNNTPFETIICEKAINIYSNFTTENSIEIYWDYENIGETTPNSWVLEIGEQGFALGTGSTYNTSSNYYNFQNLNSETTYDIYIKSKCSNTVFGSNVGPTNITTLSSCTTPEYFEDGGAGPCSIFVGWQSANETAWEIEYGISGFSLGTGTVVNTSNTYYTLTENISPNTTYEIYVRANCGSEGYSNYTNALVVTTSQDISLANLTNKYNGVYYYEPIVDGIDSSNLGSIFGAPHNVSLYDVDINNTNSLKRRFQIQFYGDSFNNTMSFDFLISTDGIITVSENDTNVFSCDGGATTSIVLGPPSNVQTYDRCDDSVLEFTFLERFQGTGGCGASDHPVTIRLTKQ